MKKKQLCCHFTPSPTQLDFLVTIQTQNGKKKKKKIIAIIHKGETDGSKSEREREHTE